MDVNQWVTMGGYASYIWSAYGLTSVILLANIWVVRQQKRKTMHRLCRALKKDDL